MTMEIDLITLFNYQKGRKLFLITVSVFFRGSTSRMRVLCILPGLLGNSSTPEMLVILKMRPEIVTLSVLASLKFASEYDQVGISMCLLVNRNEILIECLGNVKVSVQVAVWLAQSTSDNKETKKVIDKLVALIRIVQGSSLRIRIEQYFSKLITDLKPN